MEMGYSQGLRWIKLSKIYPHSILGFIHIPCRSCVLIMYSVHVPTIIMCLINSPKAGYNAIRVEFLCLSLSESKYRLCSIQVFWGSPWDGVGGKDATVGHQIRDSGRNVAITRAMCLTRPSRMPGARREGAWLSAACSYFLQAVYGKRRRWRCWVVDLRTEA